MAAICVTFYGLSILFSKLSILVLFLRYLPPKLNGTIHATIIVVVLYSLVTSFVWLFTCRPIERFWDLTVTGGSCIDRRKFNLFSGTMNTATDLIILLLPIFILHKLRLPKWEKVGLVVVLMTGGLYVPT